MLYYPQTLFHKYLFKQNSNRLIGSIRENTNVAIELKETGECALIMFGHPYFGNALYMCTAYAAGNNIVTAIKPSDKLELVLNNYKLTISTKNAGFTYCIFKFLFTA